MGEGFVGALSEGVLFLGEVKFFNQGLVLTVSVVLILFLNEGLGEGGDNLEGFFLIFL